MEIRLTIGVTPELAELLARLAAALPATVAPSNEPARTVAPSNEPARTVTRTEVPTRPAPHTDGPTVPLAAPREYTFDELAAAGAMLTAAQPEKAAAVRGLLTQFGVRSLRQLPKEHYGALANALREQGAQI